MSDIETAELTKWPLSAEELASRMCHLFPGAVGYPSEQGRLMRLIEADRAAIRLALLNEFKERLQRYYEHARGPAEMILSELLAKYSPTSKEASGGNT